jgi:TolA-binding protein
MPTFFFQKADSFAVKLSQRLLLVSFFFTLPLFSQDANKKNSEGIVFNSKDGTYASAEGYVKVFGKQRYIQGLFSYQRSLTYFKDGLYEPCVEELKIFTQLYPDHPETINALKLLSHTYIKMDDLEKSIQVDYRIYKENPTTEAGLSSYLEAAKKHISIGNPAEGKVILEKVKGQMFSSKLAKDADIELRQLQILEPCLFPKEAVSENTINP